MCHERQPQPTSMSAQAQPQPSPPPPLTLQPVPSPCSSLHLRFARRRGIPYRVSTFANGNAMHPTYAPVQDVTFTNVTTLRQFRRLKRHYADGWSPGSASFVAFDPDRRDYRLLEFLPPALQATWGLCFRPEQTPLSYVEAFDVRMATDEWRFQRRQQQQLLQQQQHGGDYSGSGSGSGDSGSSGACPSTEEAIALWKGWQVPLAQHSFGFALDALSIAEAGPLCGGIGTVRDLHRPIHTFMHACIHSSIHPSIHPSIPSLLQR